MFELLNGRLGNSVHAAAAVEFAVHRPVFPPDDTGNGASTIGVAVS